MTVRSIQKVIKIGSSSGVTIPAKDLKHAGITVGEDVEVVVRKLSGSTESTGAESDDVVLATAKGILGRYKQDFDNLSQR